ncbi:MAG: trypsin-like peptidase domain-containing protein [Acidisphaera sp.]|nr:trypsin-like peptidase domain-containing protein [Acidisphaera sp.]MBV9811444.1 trypsin-like peptidase domain-containing protein [Acetobacteraceae bacterium]
MKSQLCRAVIVSLVLAAACGIARADGPTSFAPEVKRILPAVVNIAVTETVTASDPFSALPAELQRQFRDRFARRRQEMQGAGSGFIIDASGYIVTNNHVVGQANRIVVALSDGTELPARVVGTDELTDVALIKVNPPNPLPYVTWGDSRSLEVGDWVLAAGNPFGLGGSVTAGIVSARGRDIGVGPLDDFIQIDAPINPGNSGGPVFNEEGGVVGLNTAIVSPTGGSVGIGFAIPSEIARPIVAELRDRGRVERGWLGVTLQEDDDNAGRRGNGVTIGAVDRTGPAARAGLRPGDVLYSVNGERVDSTRALVKTVAATAPGNSVRLAVRRGGQNMDVSIVVGRRPSGQG